MEVATAIVTPDHSGRVCAEALYVRFREYPICKPNAKTGEQLWTLRDWEQSASDPTPNETDRVLGEVARLYWTASEDVREQLRTLFAGNRSCPHFAYRMAIRTLRDYDPTRVLEALLILSVEDLLHDFRDTSTYLVMLRHVMRNRDSEFRRMIADVAAISSPATADFLLRFVDRDPASLRLSEFLLQETQDSHGPTIVWQVP